MSTLLNLGINVFLNPILIMVYIALLKGNENFFVEVTTNSYRIPIVPYLSVCLVFCAAYLSLMYTLHLFYSQNASFVEFLKPTNVYVNAIAAGLSAFALFFYFSKAGLEFNIFAFFIMPALVSAISITTVLGFMWLNKTFPAPEIITTFNGWISTFLICFNPILLLVYFIQLKQGASAQFSLDGFLSAMITSLILYGFISLVHFVLFKIMGRPFTFSGFFVVGTSLWYALPYITGIVFVAYQATLFYTDALNRYTAILTPVSFGILLVGILVMSVNYMRYFKQPL